MQEEEEIINSGLSTELIFFYQMQTSWSNIILWPRNLEPGH